MRGLTPGDACHFVTELIIERREGRVLTGEVVDVIPGECRLSDTARQPEDGHRVNGQDVAHMLVQVEVLQQEPATEEQDKQDGFCGNTSQSYSGTSYNGNW